MLWSLLLAELCHVSFNSFKCKLQTLFLSVSATSASGVGSMTVHSTIRLTYLLSRLYSVNYIP